MTRGEANVDFRAPQTLPKSLVRPTPGGVEYGDHLFHDRWLRQYLG